MKILKTIGIIVLILIALILLLGLVMPKKYHVERSVTINAPQELVFKYVKYFKKSQKWSPWKEYDPEMKVSYEGEDGTIGAKYMWEGNDKVGKGVQEITAIEEGMRVDSKLTFLEPFESEDMAYLELLPEGENIKVTWGFDGKMPFPMNIMLPFMGMDKNLGPDLENGLNKLKSLTEKMASDIEKYGFVIHEFKFEEKKYIGNRKILKFPEMQTFFADNYNKQMSFLKESEIEMDGYPVGLYYSWDMVNMSSDMAVAMPISRLPENIPDNFELFTISSEKALKIKFYGAYDKIGDAHMAMDAYIKDHNLIQKTPVIEMYVTDPTSEPDTTKWLTKVIYLVE